MRYFSFLFSCIYIFYSIFINIWFSLRQVTALAELRNKLGAKICKIQEQIHERRMENEKKQLSKEEVGLVTVFPPVHLTYTDPLASMRVMFLVRN